jgi:hypothetical protein
MRWSPQCVPSFSVQDIPYTSTHKAKPSIIESASVSVNDDLDTNGSLNPRSLSLIDVDALDNTLFTRAVPIRRVRSASPTPYPCIGVRLDLPEGTSVHKTYPFGMHEVYGDPWDYTVKSGMMTLHARGCPGFRTAETEDSQCDRCQELMKHPILKGILERMKTGTHENANFAFHGIGSLEEICR